MDEKAIEAAAETQKEFEVWVESQGLCVDGELNEWTGNFEYKHEHIDSMWCGWRAAIAAYRDAEIERLTAEREALKTARDFTSDEREGWEAFLREFFETGEINAENSALRAKLEAAERDAKRLEFLISNRHIRLKPFKKKGWTCASEFTNYEINVYDDAREAIDAARGSERG